MDEQVIKMIIFNLQTIIDALTSLVEDKTEQPAAPQAQSAKDDAAAKKTANINLEDVRAVLVEKSREGHREEVKNLIASYGVNTLSEIPEEKYAEVLEKAGEI